MTTYFSTPAAVVLTLLAAAMWGSWMQVVKWRKDYPIAGIAFWLYMFSFLLVWGVTLVLTPSLLPEGIIEASKGNGSVIGQILLGGAMMSCGLLFSLTVMAEVGLLLATTLSGAITSILGIATSISKEGLPDNPLALPLICGTTVLFLLASVICSWSSKMRDRDRMIAEGKDPNRDKPKSNITARVLILILLNSVLTNGWSIGTATGTAAGLPPILTCAYMATGSALGILAVCIVLFSVKKLWKTVFCIGESKLPLFLSAISACCHYGGNLISIYSMPTLSATLSFLFGRTSSVWTYFWGFFYKEYEGAGKKTMRVLYFGLLLYFLALGLLFLYNFG